MYRNTDNENLKMNIYTLSALLTNSYYIPLSSGNSFKSLATMHLAGIF